MRKKMVFVFMFNHTTFNLNKDTFSYIVTSRLRMTFCALKSHSGK